MHRVPAAAALVGLIALAGCSGSSGGTAPSVTTAPATASGSVAPVVPSVNPLTGGKPSRNPVIAVKIEDTALGRPQMGTASADIVYVEQVEGGLTRLMAIFDTNMARVEPVRSARPSDPELAQQFGHIIFVASGGSATGIAPLMASPLVKVIGDKGGPEFSRDTHRNAPENLVVDLAKVAKDYKGPTARSIGLTWSASTPAGAKPGTTVATKVGGTAVGFRWNARTKRYDRIIDGTVQHTQNGTVISTPNVIVQFCSVTVYTKDRDVLGHPAQYTHTVGTGRAVVFRGGKRIDGTWARKAVGDGTSFTANGKNIPLALGGAWVVLAAKNAPLS